MAHQLRAQTRNIPQGLTGAALLCCYRMAPCLEAGAGLAKDSSV